MAATTVGHSFGAVDQANKVQTVTLNGNFTYVYPYDKYWVGFDWLAGQYAYDVITGESGDIYRDNPPGAYSLVCDGSLQYNRLAGAKAPCDTTCTYRAFEECSYWGFPPAISRHGGYLSLKSYAINVTFGTPAATNPGIHTMDVSCTWVPGTNESSATAKWQYKTTGESTWTDSAVTSTKSGYGTETCSGTVSGLVAGTSYNFRLYVSRTTTNATTYTSATCSNSTLTDVPARVTNAATNITKSSAYLNATITPNTFDCEVTFEWDSDSGFPYANETSPHEDVPGTNGATAITKQITGLNALTPYYFRVKVVYSGGTVYGNDVSFTTTEDPAALARSQEMLPIQDFDRKYGVATTIFFVVPWAAIDNSNQFYSGAALWAGAGESQITKVTYNNSKTPTVTGPTDTTNDPVQVSGPIFRLDLEVADMQCDQAFITLTNGGTSVRDVLLRVRTDMQLGSLQLDAATGSRADTTALKATGFGTGAGLLATGGATGYGASFVGGTVGRDIDGILAQSCIRVGTAQSGAGAAQIKLDSGASAAADWYANTVALILSGTAIGQSRVIVSYDGGSKIATVNRAWGVIPDGCDYVILAAYETWMMTPAAAELASFPAANSPYGQIMVFLFQRFAFRRTQSVTTFTMLKADNSTPIGSGSVADDGSTQTCGKMA